MASVGQRMRVRLADESAEIPYLVTDATGPDDARAAAGVAAPVFYNGLPRQDTEALEIEGLDGAYEVRVLYGFAGTGALPEASVTDSFELAVTPTLVRQSRETVSATAPAGETAPDFQGAINVDADGRVGGVEWPPATPQIITRTKVVAATLITESYYRALSSRVGHVNDAAYLGHNASELLFLGATGYRRGLDAEDPWEINWKFAASLTEADVPVGPSITVSQKKGWHYLWAYYQPEEDVAAKAVVPRPVAAYVERVAPESSFTGLIP